MNQGLVALLGWLFNVLVKQSWLEGHRMYLGGASSILGGVVLIIDMAIGGHFSNEKAGAAWAAISLGYTVIGQAGKQDKIAATLKSPRS